MNNIVSVIHACDKNSYIWEKWYKYYSMYWPMDEIPTIFISEEKQLNKPKVTNLQLGVGWQQGLIKALDIHIKEDYIIYQHEDFFLTDNVNIELLGTLLEKIQEHKADILKCCGPHGTWKKSTYTKLKENNMEDKLQIYNNSNEYLTSHQMSIWSKKFLRRSLNPKHNNWAHEIEGTILVRKLNPKLLAYKSELPVPNSQPIPYIEVLKRGKPMKGHGREKYFKDDK